MAAASKLTFVRVANTASWTKLRGHWGWEVDGGSRGGEIDGQGLNGAPVTSDHRELLSAVRQSVV